MPHAKSKPEVAVVMSTYNGARYLEEQVESILAQEGVDVRLYVRDDGSTDGTVEKLERWASAGALELLDGGNLGVTRSFLLLVSQVAERHPYVALADQDDVWHTNKLLRATTRLSELDPSLPAAYCSEYTYCDQDLVPRGRSHLNRIGVDFQRMLYENVTSGNTMVMNQLLARAISRAGLEGVYTHDWWVSLVATAIGTLVFDDFSSLEYRRLSNNASASGRGAKEVLANRVRRYVAGDELGLVTRQLEKLRDEYWDRMPDDRRRLLAHFLENDGLSKARTPGRLRQSERDEVALRALFLVGRL